MRQPVLFGLCLCSGLALAACSTGPDEAEAARAIQSINLVDETNLNEIMLSAAEPAEAVSYFRRAVEDNPERMDLRRGLAKSLVRAGNAREAAQVWREIAAAPEATNDDRVAYADALIRSNDWERAAAELNSIPPTHETYERYRLEAMIADSNQDWERADSFYETAAGLTTRPAGVLNNWGYSKLSRGEHREAERLFAEALNYNPGLFTAKNNLVMARGAQRNYTLPVIGMTQTERAQLLHTLALTAIKQGDVNTGRQLLHEAVETHPQHFDVAVRSLRALDEGRTN
ncbi:tetratricopeptide repeat protein [Alkalilacustris brevis]|uniref:tetratricopeptide repeat protein n=1 Tax=Alkalilacustris brevis TaxID=2026338 RepID=UPI000E0CF9CF|nr:tetratricopeptide repeat protein [Alkalilacustris brevis]